MFFPSTRETVDRLAAAADAIVFSKLVSFVQTNLKEVPNLTFSTLSRIKFYCCKFERPDLKIFFREHSGASAKLVPRTQVAFVATGLALSFRTLQGVILKPFMNGNLGPIFSSFILRITAS